MDDFEVKLSGIFNQYGLKSYCKNNYKNEWYGQSDSGKELPDGTYYYIIKPNEGNSKAD